ncbi:hypothetical protein PFISCL1PPCAC_23024, partial [Pristionchus fissidentatus]
NPLLNQLNYFKTVMEKRKAVFRLLRTNDCTTIYNNSDIVVRALYGDSWIPTDAAIINEHDSSVKPTSAGGKYLFIAPFLSNDPMDGSEHVITIPCLTKDNEEIDISFP